MAQWSERPLTESKDPGSNHVNIKNVLLRFCLPRCSPIEILVCSPWTQGLFSIFASFLYNCTILLSLPLLPLESGGNVAQHTHLVYSILCSSQSAHEPRAGCIPTRVRTVKIKTFWLVRKLSWLSSG